MKTEKELGTWCNVPGEINESDIENFEGRINSGHAPEVELIICELAG